MNGEVFMFPRVFISSTFYDLKYVRESLGEFIKSYGFEPIKFEDGDVGYTPGEELDLSCYSAMINSDMAIVIIGGRYGSPTSDSEMIEKSFDKYISVTHKEFDTAVKNNIPIFVFVEENVYQEHRIYKKNIETLEKEDSEFKFAAVDNINIHRFINDISLFPKIPVFDFKEINDIKNILRKQWADMFLKYLQSRKDSETLSKLQPSIDSIYCGIQKMELVLEQLAKKSLGADTDDYKTTVADQKVEYAASKIASAFEFISTIDNMNDIKQYFEFFICKLFDAYNKKILDYSFSDNVDDVQKFYSHFKHEDVLISSINASLYFNDEIFSNSEAIFKEKLVNRLCQFDYLYKMGFNIKK